MSFLKSYFSAKKNIRVRFAPSPTGLLHIGSARSALFNFLFAKANGGKFILRIEDTDLERSKPEYEKDILESIQWLGLSWDEFYKQSERLELYEGYIKRLLSSGNAFYCFHSKEFLDKEYEEQIKTKKNPAHFCEFRKLPISDAMRRLAKAMPDGRQENGIIRFKTPPDFEISFIDLIRGKISFNSDTLGGDFSLAKAAPVKFTPLYNLAVVIDDYEMRISHVIRGEDHISNTPKQILIQQALSIPTPKYAHLPLILGPDRSKLGKRHGGAPVMKYREMGYLPEALVNFLALLGWNPGVTEQEIFSVGELVEQFDLNKVQKGGAIFNVDKLDWLNSHYIKNITVDELTKKIIPFLEKENLIKKENYDYEYLKKVITIEKSRLKKLNEIGERAAYFFKMPQYQPELLIWRDMLFKDVSISLNVSFKTISEILEADFNRENLEKILLKEAERAKNKDKGRLLWPLRAALTGLEKSPGPFEILEILGKKESLKRIEIAIKKLA